MSKYQQMADDCITVFDSNKAAMVFRALDFKWSRKDGSEAHPTPKEIRECATELFGMAIKDAEKGKFGEIESGGVCAWIGKDEARLSIRILDAISFPSGEKFRV